MEGVGFLSAVRVEKIDGDLQMWAPGGGGLQGVQNISRSAWVKTDAASRRVSIDVAFAVLLAASVSTHVLRGTLCIPLPPPPPHVPTSGNLTIRLIRKSLANFFS